MWRPLAVIAVLLALWGCQGTTPAANPVDPFFGRTRVEPPRTGAIAPALKDPYYVAPQVPAAQVPAATTSPSTSTPAAQSPALPRSGGVPRPNTMGSTLPPSASPASQASVSSDRVSIPSSARSATELVASRDGSTGGSARTAAALPVAAGSSATNASSVPQQVVRTLAPRPKTSEQAGQGGATSVIPGNWPTPTVLPATSQNSSNNPGVPATLPSGNSQSTMTSAQQGVVLVSASEQVGTSTTSRGLYGYDPKYQWLRGRLEYSQIDQSWRLRYIPIDGATDVYGGSVVLAKTPKLSGFERGDFVEVRGRLMTPQSNGKTFAAGYEVGDVRRLSP